MNELWLGVAALLVLALAFIFVPLLFSSSRRLISVREQTNVEIYKDQLKDLDLELSLNRISKEEHENLSIEIKRNLLSDTDDALSANGRGTSLGGRWVFLASGFVVILSSVLLYDYLGAENDLAITQLLKKSTASEFSGENVAELTQRLTQKVEKSPKEVETWYLLGNLYFEGEQYAKSVQAFNGALTHLAKEDTENRALTIALLAQSQFFAQGRKLDKATQSLLSEALTLNPNESTALGLMGVASFEDGAYLDAILYWKKLLDLMGPHNPNRDSILGVVQQAMGHLSKEERQKLLALIPKPASITVTVNIDESIRQLIPKESDLFVLAKAESGPPMPLAVQRISVSNWPVTVELNDAMAMMPQLKMSSFQNVIITARISKSGDGKAQPGDIQGSTGSMPVSTESTTVSINQIVK